MADDNKFKWLRSFGAWGGHAATVLTFLTTNWGLTLATILAVGTWLNKWAWGLVVTPAIYASAGVFLFVLWTIVGLTYLFDRRRPREIRAHLDYRYGLTFEGFGPQFISSDAGVPQAGCVGFSTQIRNFTPGPIKYSLEAADIRIDNRANPKYKANTTKGYMARGGGKTVSPGHYPAKEIKDFYGAGAVEGTADIAITYGPPDGPPIRRLKISLEFAISIPTDGILNPLLGHQLGWSYNIVSEEDEPI
ncbi:MAG TPA: hypothetical protein VK683_11485 [Rhizomicrobium sp.]|jgi:hypothetical protein|nr:hypothetical protein [Rhizomicrobium sp.]